MEPLIFILINVSLFMFIYPLLKYFFDKKDMLLRLKKYISSGEYRVEVKKQSKREYKFGMGLIANRVASMKFLNNYKEKIHAKLVRGHILLKPEEFITISFVLFFCGGMLFFFITNNIIISSIIAIICWMSPKFVLNSKIKSRLRRLNGQLSDAIVLISNSLKAGYSFFQAVDIVVKEMSGPISEEFFKLQKEINLGMTTEAALDKLVKRVQSEDLELIVTAVLIQRQVGGNLSEVLDNISSTIRDRVKVKGEVKTITAQGRMSGLIISILPPALCGILYLLSPEYMGELFDNPIGIGIIVTAVFLELIGIYFVSRIVKIEM